MIGVFDSGVGGLSVQELIEQRIPTASTVYVADHAASPYGDRAVDDLVERTTAITRFLVGQGARLVVVACNTATVMAIRELRRRFPQVPLVGMEPAVKPAAQAAHRIIVLGTRNTITHEHYRALCQRYQDGRTFWHLAAPELVRQVERAEFDRTDHLQRLMGPAVAAGAEAVVIGCTHFSALVPTILQLWPQLQVFDGRYGTLARVRSLYQEKPEAAPTHRYLTTGPTCSVRLLGRSIMLQTIDL